MDSSEHDSDTTAGRLSRRSLLRGLGAVTIGGVTSNVVRSTQAAEVPFSDIPGKDLTIRAIDALDPTRITLSAALNPGVAGHGWLIINPFTTACQILKVTSVDRNNNVTVALSSAVSSGNIGKTVYWTEEPIYNVMLFGASCDARAANDGVIVGGSTTLTSVTAGFTPNDVGKFMMVRGIASRMSATITAVTNATTVILSQSCMAAGGISNADIVWATDDTPGIKAAIDAARAAGGGMVDCPAGKTFVLEPSIPATSPASPFGSRPHSNYCFDAGSNITFEGNGGTFMLRDLHADLSTIFSQMDGGANIIKDFTIRNCIFDMNGQNNPFPGDARQDGHRAVAMLWNVKNFRFYNNVVKNNAGVGEIFIIPYKPEVHPSDPSSGVWIENNVFECCGKAAQPDQTDHTCMWCAVPDTHITNNHFSQPDAQTTGTSLDVRSPRVKIQGNTFVNVAQAITLGALTRRPGTGPDGLSLRDDPEDSALLADVQIDGNTFHNVKETVKFWPGQFQTRTRAAKPIDIHHISIVNNHFIDIRYMAIDMWEQKTRSRGNETIFSTNAHDIRIAGNVFTKNEEDLEVGHWINIGYGQNIQVRDNMFRGFKEYSPIRIDNLPTNPVSDEKYNPPILYPQTERVFVVGNEFESCSVPVLIRLMSRIDAGPDKLRDITIADNIVTATTTSTFLCQLFNGIDGLIVKGNLGRVMIDLRDTPEMIANAYLEQMVDPGLLPTASPLLDGYFGNDANGILNNSRLWVFNSTTNKEWRRFGSRWLSTDWDSSNPVDAGETDVHYQGSTRHNPAPTITRNIAFWTCMTNGVPGAWRASGIGTGTTTQRDQIRPALGQNDAGYLYENTTTGTLQRWNGSSWLG